MPTREVPRASHILYKQTARLYKRPMRRHQQVDAIDDTSRVDQWVTCLDVGGEAKALPEGLAEILTLCPNVSRLMVRDGR